MPRLTFATEDEIARLESLSNALRDVRNHLHRIEVEHSHGIAPVTTWELMRSSRTTLNAASRDIDALLRTTRTYALTQ